MPLSGCLALRASWTQATGTSTCRAEHDHSLARKTKVGLRLKPAYSDGAAMFHDPFPSLIIQDEGHLLEESLGTFSGLFETAFEGILNRLGNGILKRLRRHLAS